LAEAASIFVVEDERLVALDLAEELRSLGYEVAGVEATGERALAEIGRSQPDLVLMDIMLEGSLDGINTASELRTHVEIPFVFLTAYTDDATIARAKRTAPAGFIVKPYNRRELEAVIQIALFGRDARARERRLVTCLSQVASAIEAASDALPPDLEHGAEAPGSQRPNARGRARPEHSHGPHPFVSGSNRLRQYELSVREEEVLRYFLLGYQTTTIGRWLHISPQTIRNHLKRICRRVGVTSQAELREIFAPPIESNTTSR
jgi:DNA-binding NarL/FixJ family response regulator